MIAPNTTFGHSLLPLFSFENGYINLNHGSYGAVPKSIINAKLEWINHVELNPDQWFRYEVYDEMNTVRAQVANYVGADPEDVVFVENASHGVNSVLRSIQINFKTGGKILILDIAYGMVKNTVQFLSDTYGIPSIQLHIPFPTDSNSIVSLVQQTLNNNPDIVFASFSHIVSVPAIILPVKELVQVCRSKGVSVMIDGAHVMGQIPLNIKDIDPDYYLSNGHKWMYTPKGSAFLWVRKDKQNLTWPTTISGEGSGATQYQLYFSYEGTADYTSYLCFPNALSFRTQFGDQAIMDYMHKLASQGGDLLAALWNTEKLVDDSMIGAMVNVRVPSTNGTLLQNFSRMILERYNTYVPFYALENTNLWYCRVSAQIFNEISDFQYFGNAVLEMLRK
jgi:selenocysteine lyase/cysteine desulfurase